jgi:hypothetical protein
MLLVAIRSNALDSNLVESSTLRSNTPRLNTCQSKIACHLRRKTRRGRTGPLVLAEI